MKSVRSMTGLPVVRGGRRVGRVSGVKLDGALTRVEGVWMDAGLAGAKYLDRAEIELLGDVSVLARGRGRREKKTGKAPLYRAISADGQRVGAITDVFVDGESMKVEALELSSGFFDDLLRGRRSIPQFSVREDGDIVVDALEEGGDEK